jgi:hypothetical protein
LITVPHYTMLELTKMSQIKRKRPANSSVQFKLSV